MGKLMTRNGKKTYLVLQIYGLCESCSMLDATGYKYICIRMLHFENSMTISVTLMYFYAISAT